MTRISALDLSPFYRNSVGVDRLFDRIVTQFDHATNNNYPPYNIIKVNDNAFEIEVAVAGFGMGDINIESHEGQLTISGERKDDTERVYQHQGISARRFVRTFSLADYVEVRDAVVNSGILTVYLERIVPDNMKPKSIAITYKS